MLWYNKIKGDFMKTQMENFISHIEAVGRLSDKTVKGYASDLRHFVRYMEEQQGIADAQSVTVMHIEKFIAEELRDNAASTVGRYLASITRYFGYMVSRGIVRENPVLALEDKPKVPEKEPDVLSGEEKAEILRCCADPKNSKGAKTFFRNYAILHILFSTGMRREELVSLKLEDLRLEDNSILICKAKGGKQRMAYFSDATRGILSEYVEAYRSLFKCSAQSQYLFMGTASEQLDLSAVNRIVNKYMTIAGCKKAGRSVHSTRKRFATDAYDNSHDIYAVANIIGHSNIKTVRRYVKADAERNKAICMAV